MSKERLKFESAVATLILDYVVLLKHVADVDHAGQTVPRHAFASRPRSPRSVRAAVGLPSIPQRLEMGCYHQALLEII